MSDAQGEIIVTLASKEKHYSYEQLGVTFESPDQDILDALQPVLLEEEGFNVKSQEDNEYYTLKRVDETKRIFLFPKSVAGFLNQ